MCLQHSTVCFLTLRYRPIHHEIYLDNGILEAMRLWLEPFDDGSLTSTPVRHALYEIMQGVSMDSILSGLIVTLYPDGYRLRPSSRKQDWTRCVLFTYDRKGK